MQATFGGPTGLSPDECGSVVLCVKSRNGTFGEDADFLIECHELHSGGLLRPSPRHYCCLVLLLWGGLL